MFLRGTVLANRDRMNPKDTAARLPFLTNFAPADSRRPSSVRIISRDQPDYWTALMSAFLVVCMLAALAICSWQVEDWKNAQAVNAQPAVADHGFSVNGQRTF